MDDTQAGIATALLSPLFMAIGFFIWDKCWLGSAFGLNLFKCSLAGCLFLFVSFFRFKTNESIRQFNNIEEDIGFMLLSSLLGIVIGDCLWLYALKTLGASRTIVVDSFKPFVASLFAYILLDEPLTYFIAFGLLCSSVGVYLVCAFTPQDDDDDLDDDDDNDRSGGRSNQSNHMYGYTAAMVNVTLDAYGSVITKQFGADFNTWEINFLRFGFAAIMMALIYALAHAAVLMGLCGHRGQRRSALSMNDEEAGKAFVELPQVGNTDDAGETDEKLPRRVQKYNAEHPNWWELPTHMHGRQWMLVASGVLFVTFLCPAMSNYALFEISVGLCISLGAFGPIYCLPLGYLIKGTPINMHSICGSILAVAGVVILCSA